MALSKRWLWFTGDSTAAQFLRFGIVGASGVAVGLASLNVAMLLTGGIFLASNILAFSVAVTWNYLLNRHVTFQATGKPFWTGWAQFAVGSLGGAVGNWLVSVTLYHTVPYFGDHYNMAALLGVVAGAGANFLWARSVVFAKREPPHPVGVVRCP